MKTQKKKDIFEGMSSSLNIETSQLVTIHDYVSLYTLNNDLIGLDVKIEADLSNIPDEYHEVFLNILAARYLGRVSFGENPFSKCIPAPRKRWWQFWK